MRVTSVNVGERRELTVAGKSGVTGIFKTPLTGSVRVERLGLAGDAIGNLKHHGGADQAVYLYSAEEYGWWTEQLNKSLEPGTFGENLTLSAFHSRDVRIGDRFEVGDVLLEVTAPRIPCATLSERMNDVSFVKKFREARRPGFYARVLREGDVHAGMPVSWERAEGDAPSVVEVFDLWFGKQPSVGAIERLLRAPVASRIRDAYEPQYRELMTKG